jgi:hypothetical protein
MVLEKRHYELLARLDSGRGGFDESELRVALKILNLEHDHLALDEKGARECITRIRTAIEAQNRTMTAIARQFIVISESAKLDAMFYLVLSLSSIRSIYMLDILMGVLTDSDQKRPA